MPQRRAVREVWSTGSAYHGYVGRWSRLAADELLRWLDVPAGARWLDVGCGPGTLVEAVVAGSAPRAVLGVDRSQGFAAAARARLAGARADLQVGDAQALPVRTGAFDVVVSGLVLNFVPEPAAMVAEMARAARPGGLLALYVWDYAGGMELIHRFWSAATALDPAAAALDEAARFPVCAPAPLQALFVAAGLAGVSTRALVVPTTFRDFDDYWGPLLGGQGPAPGYVLALPEARRAALREALRASLPTRPDGSIHLTARAWAVRGVAAGAGPRR